MIPGGRYQSWELITQKAVVHRQHVWWYLSIVYRQKKCANLGDHEGTLSNRLGGIISNYRKTIKEGKIIKEYSLNWY